MVLKFFSAFVVLYYATFCDLYWSLAHFIAVAYSYAFCFFLCQTVSFSVCVSLSPSLCMSSISFEQCFWLSIHLSVCLSHSQAPLTMCACLSTDRCIVIVKVKHIFVRMKQPITRIFILLCSFSWLQVPFLSNFLLKSVSLWQRLYVCYIFLLSMYWNT